MLYLLLLLALTTLSYAADNQKPNLPFTIRFPDDNDQTTDTSTHQIPWSATMKNIVDDLGTNDPIPVPNVRKAIFYCLSKILVLSENPVILLDTSLPFNEVKKTIVDSPYLSRFTVNDSFDINYRDLLIQANYLEVHPKVTMSLAKPYVDNLRKPTITVQSSNDIVFDNLPHDLEPLPAGWLWHDMLQKIKVQTHKHDLGLDKLDILEGPIISNASSAGNVVYLWRQIGNGSTERSDLWTKLTKVNFDTQKDTRFDVLVYPDSSVKFCAFSHDGKHVLAAHTLCRFNLYTIDGVSNKKPLHHHIVYDEKLVAPVFDFCLGSIIPDDTKQLFHIITTASNQSKKLCIYFFTIDPLQPDPAVVLNGMHPVENPLSIRVRWSCVNGNLIGIDENLEKAILYKDKKLLECSFDANEEKWVYEVDDKMYEADFDAIQCCLCRLNYTSLVQDFGAIPKSFIPNIREVIPKFNRPLTNDMPYKIHFDPHHFCITDVQGNYAQTHHLMPPKLVAIWHMLHKKVRSGDPKILIDSYVLNRYYTRPYDEPYDDWRTEYEYLKPYASPAVQALCDTDDDDVMKEATKTDATSTSDTSCTVS